MPDSGDENVVKSFILKPTPVTAETLNLPIDAGWYATKDDICEGVTADSPGAAVCDSNELVAAKLMVPCVCGLPRRRAPDVLDREPWLT